MRVTFLGTGTSQGVPIIACPCEVCHSSDSKDQRLRSSVLIEIDDKILLIDSGPDFRQQMLRENVQRLDAIMFTHEHKDHIAGLDDVRAYNYVNKKPMEVYAEHRVAAALKNEFSYAFAENPYPGVPQINLNVIEENPFFIEDIKVIPIRGMHMYLPVLGYRIGSFAYLTDFNFINQKNIEKLSGVKTLVVNGLRKEEHISHFTIFQSLELIQKIKPKVAYITHISHQLGLHEEVSKELPKDVYLAYDGLQIEA